MDFEPVDFEPVDFEPVDFEPVDFEPPVDFVPLDVLRELEPPLDARDEYPDDFLPLELDPPLDRPVFGPVLPLELEAREPAPPAFGVLFDGLVRDLELARLLDEDEVRRLFESEVGSAWPTVLATLPATLPTVLLTLPTFLLTLPTVLLTSPTILPALAMFKDPSRAHHSAALVAACSTGKHSACRVSWRLVSRRRGGAAVQSGRDRPHRPAAVHAGEFSTFAGRAGGMWRGRGSERPCSPRGHGLRAGAGLHVQRRDVAGGDRPGR